MTDNPRYRTPEAYDPANPPAADATMPQYSSFWTGQNNPWAQYANEQTDVGQGYQDQIQALINQLKGSGQGRINRHMNSLMGGQKSLLDDYVKRAAGAGVQRGGMNTVGGSPLASVLAQQANKDLVSGYNTNYSQAASLAQGDASRIQNLLTQLQSGASTANSARATGLSGVANNMAMRREDYGKDLANNLSWRGAY